MNYSFNLNGFQANIPYVDIDSNLTDKEFSDKYSLQTNADFLACKKYFEDYSGTLKNKLSFILRDFCKNMDFIPIDTHFFYSPVLFDQRLKNARNVMCHGQFDKKIDWRSAANDTYLLQELIYFIILKYGMKLKIEKIKECIDLSFGWLNYDLSLCKTDDRIEVYKEN